MLWKGGWDSFHLPQSLGEGVDASVCACRGLAQTVQELGDASGLCLISDLTCLDPVM